MEFKTETYYNQKTLTAMARAVRKTLRSKRSKKSHILAVVVIIFGALLIAVDAGSSDGASFSSVATGIAMLVMIVTLAFEDKLNGYFAGKRMLKGTEKTNATFTDSGYTSNVEMGTSGWSYENIKAIAKTKDNYIAFVFSQSHAQMYDLSTLTGGSVEEFIAFLEEKTGKKVQYI